jgi:hypothetical protein
MKTATEYTHNADECLRLAQQTQEASIKSGFLALANYWRRLSEKSSGKPSEH